MSDTNPYLPPSDLTSTDISPSNFATNPRPPPRRLTPTPPPPSPPPSSSSPTLPLPHLTRATPASSHYSAQATAAFLDFILIEQSTTTNPHNLPLPLAQGPTISRSPSPSFKSAKSSRSKSPPRSASLSRRPADAAAEFTDIELDDLSPAAPPAAAPTENASGFVVVDLDDATRFAASEADVARWVALFGYSSGVAAGRIEEGRRNAADPERSWDRDEDGDGDEEGEREREARWQAVRGVMEGRGYDREAFEHLVELERRGERVGREEGAEVDRGRGMVRGRGIWGMVKGYWRW